MTMLVPAPGILQLAGYAPARRATPCDLDLAGTEVGASSVGIAPVAADATAVERYPDELSLTGFISYGV
jgi:hypothetical protein